jgi:hypothetical protein
MRDWLENFADARAKGIREKGSGSSVTDPPGFRHEGYCIVDDKHHLLTSSAKPREASLYVVQLRSLGCRVSGRRSWVGCCNSSGPQGAQLKDEQAVGLGDPLRATLVAGRSDHDTFDRP